jgi:predicted CXXCH cytochrome family protein
LLHFLRLSPALIILAAGCMLFRQEVLVHADEADPDASCAPCHRAVYERYRNTPMAHASGPAIDGVIPANFRHAASGVQYHVYAEDGAVWMNYQRDAASGNPLNGQRQLRFYIGSGKRGRTFLFEQGGYWFEAPINWYAKKQIWDMAPNHQSDREMPLTMPVDWGCLHCHSSGVAYSLPDARNHFAGSPFRAGGISCEGCHGDGSEHVASQGKVAMLKLDALEPVRRESVCLNCHLEGDTSVDRAGKRADEFRPGDNLFDYSEFFVYRGEKGSGGRATSQFEALLQSECRKKSGELMTCTTCHDPHGSPAPEQRVMFYRERCLKCHTAPAFASHHPENLDCTSCHMKRSATSDIAHEQVTDHFIRKRPPERSPSSSGEGLLEAVGSVRPGDRELGLAYAEMAARGDREATSRALELLSRGEKQAGGAPGDPELHNRLGFLEQVTGHPDAAAAEYERAIQADPNDSLALGDLGLIQATKHQYAAAERLWKAAFNRDPVQVGAGMNLAIVECETGDPRGAIESLTRVLEFAPDDSKAYKLMSEIESGNKRCGGR